MNLTSSYTNHLHQQPPRCLLLKRPSRVREFRFYRRRRLKRNPNLTIRSNFISSENNIIQILVSQLPSFNSLDWVASAFGLASGFTLYLSRLNGDSGRVYEIGDWVFFTSPTPFNRFVFLRCPSVSLEGNEMLEDVNARLVKEDRHFVRLNSGRIQVRDGDGGPDLEEQLEYQRVCVNAEDGGVISLDWPANLDLEEEHGLDLTLVLVPGTTEGSMDKNVRKFVCEALKHGCFPIVMNPRGCAGSPLTTARLFTAADSDDITSAIKFINKGRPWTTLMGVGWGYGANMLTKYLAEVGERTPLTAATCIDNPFDLEEATRFSPHHTAIDHRLVGGLRDILRSNKELFQGKAKGFDVDKALTSNSVRDFDKAICMVSYGCEAIEDFYSKSSTRNMVGNVKIPVLFIQNDDSIAPLFSIPRSSIAENPFTSLLLCSCLPSRVTANGRSSVSWIQHLTIEWLTAVELALLKGRHPLLKDVDVTINPPKGLAIMEGRPSDKSGKGDKLLDLALSNALNLYPVRARKDMLQESDTVAGIRLRSRQDSQGNSELEGRELQNVENGALQERNSPEGEPAGEDSITEDSERGKMLQSAQVIMNMLDSTIPGTLTKEKKKKVLMAMDQGESLLNALQDAVPEDVRGKLRAAVSGIVQTQGTNLRFDKVLNVGHRSNVSAGSNSMIQEGVVGAEVLNKDHSSDQVKISDHIADDPDTNQPGMNQNAAGPESNLYPSMQSQETANGGSEVMSTQGDDNSASVNKDCNDMDNHEDGEYAKAKMVPHSDISEEGSETNVNPNSFRRGEKEDDVGETIPDEQKGRDGGTTQLNAMDENNINRNEEKTPQPSTDQTNATLGNTAEEANSPEGSPSEAQPIEKEGGDNQKKDGKIIQPILDPTRPVVPDSSPPNFSVTQALDALTGMDDSTQVAVNNVFGVIENMITQLEEGENKLEDSNNAEDSKINSISKKTHVIDHNMMENKEENMSDTTAQSVPLHGFPASSHHENMVGLQHAAGIGTVEEEPAQNTISIEKNFMDSSQESNTINNADIEEKEKNDQFVGSKRQADNLHALQYANNIPLYAHMKPYSSNDEHIQRYVFSKIPVESLDVDSTTALLLDYFPEEDQWKLLEQPENIGSSIKDVGSGYGIEGNIHSFSPAEADGDIIEPTYVVLNTENQQEPITEYQNVANLLENVTDRSKELTQFVRNILLDCLKLEVGRRLSAADNTNVAEFNLSRDLELFAEEVSLNIAHEVYNQFSEYNFNSMDLTSEKVGTLDGDKVVRVISSAVLDAIYLKRVLPVGVIVGSSLAALRKYFNVAAVHNYGPKEAVILDEKVKRKRARVTVKELEQKPVEKSDQDTSLDRSVKKEGENTKFENLNRDSVMVGAVTAALGASALLVQQEGQYKSNETAEHSSKTLKDRENEYKLEETISERSENNIVSSFAEKAMSVAGPVVPTKDGEVDQERLVTMLADLGQRGGMLRLIGKMALLWAGLRGAVSLTDRLMSFLRIAERPLFQRILGFVSMVLVLWSPVVLPLLPTLVQSWTTNTTSRMAELACIFGLYAAVMMLIVLWGKRIRGYESPLQQYGLDLTSSGKIPDLLKGLIGGVVLVLSIHSVNVLLGWANLSWPSSLPSSTLYTVTRLKLYGKMLVMAGHGIVLATVIAVAEELLFRSWLSEEIITDLGHHRGIIISGLMFSLFHRSPQAIPGLWLLSLSLAGAKQRSEGSLAIPIGMRAGMIASSFILQRVGILTYNPNLPLWVTGTHQFEPFTGIVGLVFSLVLAVILYPRNPPREKLEKKIREQNLLGKQE